MQCCLFIGFIYDTLYPFYAKNKNSEFYCECGLRQKQTDAATIKSAWPIMYKFNSWLWCLGNQLYFTYRHWRSCSRLTWCLRSSVNETCSTISQQLKLLTVVFQQEKSYITMEMPWQNKVSLNRNQHGKGLHWNTKYLELC